MKPRLLLLILTCLPLTAYRSPFLWAADYNKIIREYKTKILHSQKKLKGLDEGIRKTRSQSQRVREEEEALETGLKRLETHLAKLKGEITKSVAAQATREREIEKIRKAVAETTLELQAWRARLRAEILMAYKRAYLQGISHQAVWVSLVLKSPTPAEFARKFNFLKRFARQKAALVQATQSSLGSLERLERGLRAERTELHKEQIALAAKRLDVAKLQREQKALLEGKRQLRQALEAEIRKLSESARVLEGLVDLLEKRAQATEKAKKDAAQSLKRISQKKGSIHWPVQGVLIARFGKDIHPDLPNTFILNNGIRIHAGTGTPVRAVENGSVVYAGDFQNYGNTVILEHGGGFYSVYSNLGEIRVEENQLILAEDSIGSVGGSSLYNKPHLYFEWRRGKTPADPLLWLSHDKTRRLK